MTNHWMIHRMETPIFDAPAIVDDSRTKFVPDTLVFEVELYLGDSVLSDQLTGRIWGRLVDEEFDEIHEALLSEGSHPDWQLDAVLPSWAIVQAPLDAWARMVRAVSCLHEDYRRQPEVVPFGGVAS